MSLAHLQSVLDGSPFAKHYGFRVESAVEGHVYALLPREP